MNKTKKTLVDTKLLEKIIKESGLKKKRIAELLNLSPYSLSKKIRNENEFLLSEIACLCSILHLSPEMRERIFFTLCVD